MRLLGASPPGGHIATVNPELQCELFTYVAFRDCSEISFTFDIQFVFVLIFFLNYIKAVLVNLHFY